MNMFNFYCAIIKYNILHAVKMTVLYMIARKLAKRGL